MTLPQSEELVHQNLEINKGLHVHPSDTSNMQHSRSSLDAAIKCRDRNSLGLIVTLILCIIIKQKSNIESLVVIFLLI